MDDALHDDDGLLEPELIDEIVVLEAAPLEPLRAGPPALVQAAAVAATSFVAGAAAAAMLSRRRTRQSLVAGRPARALPQRTAGATGTTQTFLVHIQSIRRP
jgi:hypothetical protein